MSLLKLENVHSYYGRIHALKGISLEVNEGEIVTLIGANGAGKSTTLRTISGILHRAKAESCSTGRMIFSTWSRAQNRVRRRRPRPGRARNLPQTDGARKPGDGRIHHQRPAEIERRMEYAFSLFPRLKERINQKGGTLSGGEQQMLATARGLMLKPKILMLDEPSMGLAPLFVERIFDIIQRMNQEGTTILLVEQNALMALSIAHRGYVLQTGQIVLADTAANLKANPMVQHAYLGIE